MFPPEAFQSLLTEIARVLESRGIRFALTGGLVSAFYSEPRYTQDADLVIHREDAIPVLDALIDDFLTSGYLLDRETIRRAVASGRAFQLFHKRELLKLDLYPHELVPGELQRAIPAEIFSGVMLPIITATDLVGCKLVWISKGSHKARRDIRQLMRRLGPEEKSLAQSLAGELGHRALLDEVLAEKDEIDLA